MDWIWILLMQQQAQEAERRRQAAEAEARAKAEADAQAARDAEAKRQAQIAQQRQQDAAAAQKAEQDRRAAIDGLPGAADPYGEYRASINLDNSATQNAGRTIASSVAAANANPLSGFTDNAPKTASLASMFSSAVAPPRRGQQNDFATNARSSNSNAGGNQPVGGASSKMF